MEFSFTFNKKRPIKYQFSSKKDPHFSGTGEFKGSLRQIDEVIGIRIKKIEKKYGVERPNDIIFTKIRE